MEVQLINTDLIQSLHEKATSSERKRVSFDMRTTPADGSQRILNVLEPGTKVPIHRHMNTTESVVCIEGCYDEIFYEELPNITSGGPVHNGEVAMDESCFKEVARFRICPRENKYGIQVPPMIWHTVEIFKPTAIFEAKDGAYGK